MVVAPLSPQAANVELKRYLKDAVTRLSKDATSLSSSDPFMKAVIPALRPPVSLFEGTALLQLANAFTILDTIMQSAGDASTFTTKMQVGRCAISAAVEFGKRMHDTFLMPECSVECSKDALAALWFLERLLW